MIDPDYIEQKHGVKTEMIIEVEQTDTRGSKKNKASIPFVTDPSIKREKGMNNTQTHKTIIINLLYQRKKPQCPP